MADDNPSMLLTNAGAALLARVMAGETLTFTRGAFGDSFQNGQIVLPTTDEQAQMEHLINERIELPLIKINPTGAYAEIDMQVESAKVDNSFMISEIGLFAKIGDEQEKLYGYFNAGLKGDYMPASHSAIAKDYVYTVIVVIGNAQNVTAIINKNDYELPTASTTQKGGIKIGNGLYMSGDSLNASAQNYSLPTASTSTKGGVKIGTGLSMNGETLNATVYNLPTASTTQKGGIKIGTGLSMNGEVLNATAYTLPTASTTQKGGIKIGDGLYMSGDSLNASAQNYSLPTASASVKGGVKLGEEFKINGELLRLSGKVNTKLDMNDVGFSVGNAPVDYSYSQVGFENAKITLDGATVKSRNKSQLDLSSVDITLGSSNNPASIDMKGATVNVEDVNLVVRNMGTDYLNANTPVKFQRAVSLYGSALFENEAHFDGKTYFAENSFVDFESGSSIYAVRDSINVAGSTINGGTATISGNVRFTGTPVFENGVTGISIPTASSSTKGGVKIGTGLSMSGETLNVTATGGLTNPVEGTLTIKSGSNGGTVNANGATNGGVVSLCGGTGGSIHASGTNGGSLIMTGTGFGGVINLKGTYPGEIQGCPKFTDGFQLGDNKITALSVSNGKLVITVNSTTYTIGGVNIGTVASSAQGDMWMSSL